MRNKRVKKEQTESNLKVMAEMIMTTCQLSRKKVRELSVMVLRDPVICLLTAWLHTTILKEMRCISKDQAQLIVRQDQTNK